MEETEIDGGPKMQEFDIITRRYLDYCQLKGLELEDYVPGLKQEEVDEFLFASIKNKKEADPLNNSGNRKTQKTNNSKLQSRIKEETLNDTYDGAFKNSNNLSIEEIIIDGSILSNQKSQFAEYLRRTGMREYDNGTLFFYEEELDIKQKTFTNNITQISESDIKDYDLDLINELFD